jgi:hypothetical protein
MGYSLFYRQAQTFLRDKRGRAPAKTGVKQAWHEPETRRKPRVRMLL